MCGITGAFGSQVSERAVRAMTRALSHRGPDDEGIARIATASGAPCGIFGHRRLAILDLSAAGHQPMRAADGMLALAFNGEIYNFRELRDELRRTGSMFHGGSDTEVLLEGWRREGIRFLERLQGMFAFALWDANAGRGYLVRDPFGIKPLYVAQRDGRVLFASELRSLLVGGDVAPLLSPDAVRSYLEAGSVAEPLALVEGVGMVAAGCVVEVAVTGGRAEVQSARTWAPPIFPAVENQERDAARAASAVRVAMRNSVRRHMVSDVPVGLFLSGGIDSSAVVALASEATGAQLDTFTVVFSEAEYNEAAVARRVARRYATRHHEVELSAAQLLDALPEVFAAMDQPSLDGINTYVVSRAVRASGIKVVLSGLGGDELFAGYPSFGRACAARRLAWAPRWMRHAAAAGAGRLGSARTAQAGLLLADGAPALNAYRASRTVFGSTQVAALSGGCAPTTPRSESRGLSLLGQVSAYELEGYMRSTLLRDSDVFSMAHGLELRVPFLDREVAQAAASAHDSLKIRRGSVKPLLVAAVRDLLPRDVWDRPKQGFTLPFEQWLRGELRGAVDAVLSSDAPEAAGLRPAAVRRVWRDFLERRPGVNWSRAWALYTLVRWCTENGAALPVQGTPPFAISRRA